ncbi:MAG: carboxylesterase family protein [Planctomycetota bacterium]|jgi:predicted esterase
MRKIIAVFGLLCLVLSPGVAQAGQSADDDRTGFKKETAPGGISYLIKTPPGFNSQKSAPMVLALHGAGDSPENFKGCFSAFSWDDNRYIKVVPYPPTPGAWFVNRDEPKLAEMIKDLRKRYKISHVICYGFSRGAQMCYAVSLKYPKLINAAIPHSGGLAWSALGQVPANSDTKNMPVAIIHGDADGSVPVSHSRKAEKWLKELGFKWVRYEEIAGWQHRTNGPAVERAHKWVMECFGKGAGGLKLEEVSEEEVSDALARIAGLINQKKFDDAAALVEDLCGKGRKIAVGLKNRIYDALIGSFENGDRNAKLFCANALGYIASSKCVSLLKKTLKAAVTEKDEELYMAVLGGLANVGEKALSTLHSEMKKKTFDYRGARAAVEAVVVIGSRKKSVKPLVSLLSAIEKKKNYARAMMLETVKTALENLTGSSLGTAKEWKEWLKKNKL